MVHHCVPHVQNRKRVTLGGRAATCVEVSLGGAWRADSTRVWVRNGRGDLERLAASERVIAFDQPMSRAAVLPTIRVLVESDDGLSRATPVRRGRSLPSVRVDAIL